MRQRLRYVVISIALLALILGIGVGCAKEDKTEAVQIGKYVMAGTEPEDSSWVLIKEGEEFEFVRHIATSYLPRGNYSIEGTTLTLYVDENELFTFTIDGDTLIFEDGPIPRSMITKGAVFKLSI